MLKKICCSNSILEDVLKFHVTTLGIKKEIKAKWSIASQDSTVFS